MKSSKLATVYLLLYESEG